MEFPTTAVPSEIPGLMRRAGSIVEWRQLERRVENLREQIINAPYIAEAIYETFGLEIAFVEVRKHYRNTGRYPWPPKVVEYYRLYSFISVLARLHHRLNNVGKTRLNGMIPDGLKSDRGLAQVAFEIQTVGHLLSGNFDVLCNDYEDLKLGGTYDFLASKGGAETEVECKFISTDIGRKIHQRQLFELAKHLKVPVQAALKDSPGGKLVRISIPDRLTGAPSQLAPISQAVEESLSEQRPVQVDGICRVSSSSFEFDKSPFNNRAPHHEIITQAKEYFAMEHEAPNRYMFMHYRPRHGAIAVSVESDKPDKVLDGIFQQLKGSVRNQFSGNRPATLYVYLSGLTEEELVDLGEGSDGKPSGLNAMAIELLRRRPTLHTLSFLASGVVQIRTTKTGEIKETSVQESGRSYFFRNHDHPLANDRRHWVV